MNRATIVKGSEFGSTLRPYENQWVALDRGNNVLAHDLSLKTLVQNLSPEQNEKKPIFMQVLPHDVSFVG